jgi:hypothetical protein
MYGGMHDYSFALVRVNVEGNLHKYIYGRIPLVVVCRDVVDSCMLHCHGTTVKPHSIMGDCFL